MVKVFERLAVCTFIGLFQDKIILTCQAIIPYPAPASKDTRSKSTRQRQHPRTSGAPEIESATESLPASHRGSSRGNRTAPCEHAVPWHSCGSSHGTYRRRQLREYNMDLLYARSSALMVTKIVQFVENDSFDAPDHLPNMDTRLLVQLSFVHGNPSHSG